MEVLLVVNIAIRRFSDCLRLKSFLLVLYFILICPACKSLVKTTGQLPDKFCINCSEITVVDTTDSKDYFTTINQNQVFVEIKKFPNHEFNNFKKFVDDRTAYIKELLRPTQDPYFGAYDKPVSCTESFINSMKRSKTENMDLVSYSLNANSTLQYGSCSNMSEIFQSEITYMHCHNIKTSYQIKFFWSKKRTVAINVDYGLLCNEKIY